MVCIFTPLCISCPLEGVHSTYYHPTRKMEQVILNIVKKEDRGIQIAPDGIILLRFLVELGLGLQTAIFHVGLPEH